MAVRILVKPGASFWADIRDKGALPRVDAKADWGSVPSLLFLFLGGAASLVSNLEGLSILLPPWPSAWLPFTCGLLGLMWSVSLVAMKSNTSEQDTLALTYPIGAIKRYRYIQSQRNLAKLALLPLVLMLFTSGFSLYQSRSAPPAVRFHAIIGGTEGDSAYRFQIAIQNDLSRPVWINHMEIYAQGYYLCAFPPFDDRPRVYRISSQLRVSPSSDGSMLHGHLEERRDRPGMLVPLTGTIHTEECGARGVSLSAPLDQEIIAKSTYTFDLVLPHRFSVQTVVKKTKRNPTDQVFFDTLQNARWWDLAEDSRMELIFRTGVGVLRAPLQFPE